MARPDQEDIEDGTIAVMLERSRRRIPNLLAIKEQLAAGGTLGELEIAHLEEIFEGANRILAIVEQHPELQEISAKIINLYTEIMDMAVANAEKG
ncbi:MAG: hypothetical protein ABJ308_05525 [Halieaceae bacterium]